MMLVEREESLEKLNRITKDVASELQTGTIVLVTGEAGIGKTSLIRQFSALYEKPVLWGLCDPLSTPRPLAPLIDIVEQSKLPNDFVVDASVDRFAIFSNFLDTLKKITNGTVIVFEDVHWAESATLDLLKYLGRRIQQTRVVLILSYRDDEVTSSHPLHSLLGILARSATTERLTLQRLSLEGVARLTENGQLDSDAIHDITQGNPFFVTEIVSDKMQSNIPTTIRDAVLGRKSQLSPDAQSVLDMLAVIGTHCEAQLLKELLNSDMQRLDECLSSGILQTIDNLIMFRHDLSRQTILNAIPTYQKQNIHQSVLDVMERLPQYKAKVAELAHHADGAGDTNKLKKYALQAAKEAKQAEAYPIVRQQYQRILQSNLELEAEEKATILEQYANACRTTGYFQQAVIACKQAVDIWRDLDNQLILGQCLSTLSTMYFPFGETELAEETSIEAINILEAIEPSAVLGDAYVQQAFLRMLNRDIEEAIEWGQRAINISTRFEDTLTLSRAYNAVGSSMLFVAPDVAHGLLNRSLELSKQINFREGVSRAYINLTSGFGEIHQFKFAEPYGRVGIAFTQEHDFDLDYHYLLAWQSLNYLYLGEWEKASEQALEVIDGVNVSIPSHIMALVTLGRLGTRRGEEDALELLDEALSLALSTNHLQRIAPVRLARAEWAFYQHDVDQILHEVTANYDMALKYQHPWFVGEMLYWQWRSGETPDLPNYIPETFKAQIEGNYEKASHLWAKLSCPYEQAIALSDSQKQEDLLQSLDILFELQATPTIALVKQKLRDINADTIPRGQRQSTRENPANLTNRQMDVLIALAKGLTNKEIARKLYISPKTVEHHVSTILSKLHVSSRQEATNFAYENDLCDPK